jgi:hypothetical protein
MKKLALSVVVLMVAGAGVSLSGAGCSSSSSSSTGSSSGGTDSGSGSDVTVDTGSSSGSDSSSGTDTGSSSGGGDDASDAPACMTPDGGSLPFEGLDGGPNPTCTTCLGTSCCTEQHDCVFDPNMAVSDDAGGMEPACVVYLTCVYTEVLTLNGTNDAGSAANAATAQADCAGADGGNFPASSITAGGAIATCLFVNCGSGTCTP